MTAKAPKLYKSRSSAVRAARAACKAALDAPDYQAYEGPDYEIHPDSVPDDWRDRFYFRLRGPAKDAADRKAGGE